MTTREFYEAVVAAAISDELTEFATEGIAKLNNRAAKDKEKKAENRLASDALYEALYGYVTDENQCADEIFAKATADGVLGSKGQDLTIAMVRSKLSTMVKDGRAVKENEPREFEIIGEDGNAVIKTKKVMCYRLA